MKIIKHGNKYKNNIKRITCPTCGCVMEINENDYKEDEWRDYDGIHGKGYGHLYCLECYTYLRINENLELIN
jgi:hypothetical protein